MGLKEKKEGEKEEGDTLSSKLRCAVPFLHLLQGLQGFISLFILKGFSNEKRIENEAQETHLSHKHWR